MIQVSLKEYLDHICNWCERHFDTEPIYNDELKVYAFCSQECVGKSEIFYVGFSASEPPEVTK